MKALYISLLVATVAFAACKPGSEGGKEGTGATTKEGGTESHGAMAMDSTMSGMAAMEGSGMAAMMPAHMDSMMKMSPERMTQMMAGHERMMSQTLDQMGGEMRQMNMKETPEWTALTDSVKQDLADLPGLQGQALSRRMTAHSGRVNRLLAMHKKMMEM